MKLDLDSKFSYEITSIATEALESLPPLTHGNISLKRRILQIHLARKHNDILNLYRLHERTRESNDIASLILKTNYISVLQDFIHFLTAWFFGFFYIFYAKFSSLSKYEKLIIIQSPLKGLASSEVISYQLYNSLFASTNSTELKAIVLDHNTYANESNVYFSKRPILSAIKHISFGLLDIVQFYALQFGALASYIQNIWRHPSSSVLKKDFIYLPYIAFLDRRKHIHAICKTNSEYQDQEFWLESKNKSYRFYFIWYSLNTMPFQFKNFDSYHWYPFDFSYIEYSFTWSKSHAYWLSHFSNKEAQLTKPIVFHKGISFSAVDQEYIAIFDIPPVYPEVFKNIFYNYTDMYTSLENSSKFITDIVEVITKNFPDTKILLKSKRKPTTIHIKDYYNLLFALEKEGLIHIIDQDTSVLEIIANASAVISMPFTSTNFVSSSKGIPSIYYDPSSRLQANFLKDESNIYFSQGINELQHQLGVFLKKKR